MNTYFHTEKKELRSSKWNSQMSVNNKKDTTKEMLKSQFIYRVIYTRYY